MLVKGGMGNLNSPGKRIGLEWPLRLRLFCPVYPLSVSRETGVK